MLESASRKLGLEQAVMGAMGGKNMPDKAMTDMLLKHGAYHLVNEEPGMEYSEADIDEILTKMSRIVKHETEGSLNISKATVAMSEGTPLPL